jgi:hypothetical protein
MTTITVDRVDLSHAIFGLGRYIQYSLEAGMDERDLHSSMQAYLNLAAAEEGLEPPCYQTLLAQKVDVSPEIRELMNQWTPTWLPDGEKLRLVRRSRDSGLNMSCPDIPGEG